MMTNAYKTSGVRLPDKRLPIESPTNGANVLATRDRDTAEKGHQPRESRFAIRTTSCNRAIVPAKGKSTLRVMESIATRVIGPHRASRGPTTAGPTRPVQNGSHRKAPDPRSGHGHPRGNAPVRGPACGGQARCEESCRHIPPWRASNAARGEFCDQPTERREPAPTPVQQQALKAFALFRGGVLPSLTHIERYQMPYMLRFHDTDDTTEMPEPALVGHAAAWAAERGYWDVATCLMELAHALAELEAPTPVQPVRGTCAACGGPYELRAEGPTRLVHLDLGADHDPVAADPRYVNQDAPHPESRLTKALERARAEDATGRFCSHGYLVSIAGQHTATGGACSDVQPPPCSGHEKNDLSCSLCGAQRRAFYDDLHQQLS